MAIAEDEARRMRQVEGRARRGEDPARANNWEGYATGASGDIEVERAFLRQFGRVYETFCKKQRDYGRGNIAKFGAPGVLVRVSDKVERMVNLSRREGPPANETVDDSWLDTATYGLIGMVCRAGEWPGSPEAGARLLGEFKAMEPVRINVSPEVAGP